MSDPSRSLRPRSGPEIVDAAFQIVRRHYPSFIVLGLLPYLVIVPLETLIPSLYGEDAGFVATLAYMALYTAVAAIPGAASMVLASASLLGERVSAAAALRQAAAHPWTVVATSLLVTGATLIGIVLFIVPGISVMVSYFSIPGIAVLENLGVRASLRRSRELTGGARWLIFLSYVVPTLVYYAITAFVELWVQELSGQAPLARALYLLLAVLAAPILSAIAIVLYYDRRIRKEAFDLEWLGARLGSSAEKEASRTSAR
jgi:hypothetical protein